MSIAEALARPQSDSAAAQGGASGSKSAVRLTIGAPALWLAAFVALPAAVVFAISLTSPRLGIPPVEPLFAPGVGVFPEFTGGLHNYALIFSDPYFVEGLLGSLRIAASATLICLLIAYPIAAAIARTAERWRGLLLIMVMLPFWTSFLIRIYAWITILNSNGLINTVLLDWGVIEQPLELLYTDFAVLLGIVYAYLPFMILPIYAVLDRIEPDVLEAAADLGAPPIQRFFWVLLPLTWPGIAAGVLIVFVPALGEFVIPELLGGSDYLMIGRMLWTETFQNRDWPMAAAIAISLLVVVIGPITVARRLTRDEGAAK